jgi:hypothetical protein
LDSHNFSSADWNAIFRACRALRIEPPAPAYFRDFLAQRLMDAFPDLAAIIWQMDGDGLDDVCAKVRDRQDLAARDLDEEELTPNGNGVANGKNGE